MVIMGVCVPYLQMYYVVRDINRKAMWMPQYFFRCVVYFFSICVSLLWKKTFGHTKIYQHYWMHSSTLYGSMQQKGQQKLFELKNDYIYDLFVKLFFFSSSHFQQSTSGWKMRFISIKLINIRNNCIGLRTRSSILWCFLEVKQKIWSLWVNFIELLSSFWLWITRFDCDVFPLIRRNSFYLILRFRWFIIVTTWCVYICIQILIEKCMRMMTIEPDTRKILAFAVIFFYCFGFNMYNPYWLRKDLHVNWKMCFGCSSYVWALARALLLYKQW